MASKLVTDKNRLSITKPDIASEWHPTKNGDLKPDMFAYGSHKKIWWICSTNPNHSWESTIYNRSKSTCPYCSRYGKLVCVDNCLATKYPEIAAQLHPTKNEFTAYEIRPTTKKKAVFVCEKGHEYIANVCDRICKKSGCPACNESHGEIMIRNYLSKKGIRFVPQYSIDKGRNSHKFDFHLPDFNLMIEFHGIQHYQPESFGTKKRTKEECFRLVQRRDAYKSKWCRNNDVHLFVIPYWEIDNIEQILNEELL